MEEIGSVWVCFASLFVASYCLLIATHLFSTCCSVLQPVQTERRHTVSDVVDIDDATNAATTNTFNMNVECHGEYTERKFCKNILFWIVYILLYFI